MQCRAVARRLAAGSLTVLGDLAQATTPWATRSWAEALGHLGKPDAHVEQLTRGFRVPGEVIEYAARLLGDIEVDTRSESGAPHTWAASESLSTTRVGMVPPHVLRQMRPGHALLVHGTLPPAHLRPRAYYREPSLRRRSRLTPQTPGDDRT